MLSRSYFEKVVDEVCMNSTHCPWYRIPYDAYPNPPLDISSSRGRRNHVSASTRCGLAVPLLLRFGVNVSPLWHFSHPVIPKRHSHLGGFPYFMSNSRLELFSSPFSQHLPSRFQLIHCFYFYESLYRFENLFMGLI